MKRTLLTALVAAGLMANTSWAQVDLGGAISGAINGATGNTQAPNTAPPKAAVQGAGTAEAAIAPGTATAGGSTTAGVNAGTIAAGAAAGGAVNQPQGQSWFGQVGNDIRSALQQADNGVMRLQNNLNPSLQQRGFQPGDQLLDANGQPLTQAQFDQFLQTNPGQVRVLRNGQTVVINGGAQGNLQGSGRQMNMQGQMNSQGMAQASGRQRFGITMNPSSEGVKVAGVTVGSPAAQAGIRPGDQILSVNGQQISDPNSMIQLVSSASADQPLDVQFRRNGQVMQSQVSLASSSQTQAGVYQAGYPQGQAGYPQGQHPQGQHPQGQHPQGQPGYAGSSDNRSGAHADMNARLDQLERMVQDLRDQVEKMSKSNDK